MNNNNIENMDCMNQCVLLACNNLHDIPYVLTYLMACNLIKDFDFLGINDNSFDIEKDEFTKNELSNLQKNASTLKFFSDISFKDNIINEKKYIHTPFAYMKNVKNKIMADIIIQYNGESISDDNILPLKLNTISKNKWYRLNNLHSPLDYLRLIKWYMFTSKKIIKKINDDWTLCLVKVELNDDWTYFSY